MLTATHRTLVVIPALLALFACSKDPAVPGTAGTNAALERLAPMEVMARGSRLFQENCALCHGPQAQGHPDWQTPGVVAAPPLNGTGNDWKRSRADMAAIIKNGVKHKKELVMPGWAGRLSDDEISDIITWYQALWADDVYSRWRKANTTPEPAGKG